MCIVYFTVNSLSIHYLISTHTHTQRKVQETLNLFQVYFTHCSLGSDKSIELGDTIFLMSSIDLYDLYSVSVKLDVGPKISLLNLSLS